MTDLNSGYTDHNGKWVEAKVPVMTAFDATLQSHLIPPDYPEPGPHVPTQETLVNPKTGLIEHFDTEYSRVQAVADSEKEQS